ncbi:WD40 repeat [Nannocystis exedens]|uniref:WD40 repeat n=1 Tax=Nannocystis exedens TaxID=54 RepID=A0A1I2E513_9BACT|nr:hypothetical protein [Nannocystis exedens]PCC69271.1 WD domain, G-beta repeat [Nannocystis exedens]SFE87618.1 WD40 repeat [Nannocystis exedens]
MQKQEQTPGVGGEGPNSVDAYNNEAVALLEAGRAAEGEQALVRALWLDPLHTHARYNLGLLQWRQGRTSEAVFVATLEAMRDDGQGDAQEEARRFLGWVHGERGVPGHAAEQARGLLRGLVARATGRVPQEPPVTLLASQRMGTVHVVRTADDGTVAVCLEAMGSLYRWDGKRPLVPLPVTGAEATAIALTPDGRVAAAATKDRRVAVFDVAAVKRRCAPIHEEEIAAIALSADGGRLLTASGRILSVWETKRGEPVARWQGERVFTEAWLSASGTVAVAGTWEGCEAWDVEARARRWQRPGEVFVVAADGRSLVLRQKAARALEVIDVASGKRRCARTGHCADIHDVRVSRDGTTIVTAGHDRTLQAFDGSTGARRRFLQDDIDSTTYLRISPSGRFVLYQRRDRSLALWDLASGQSVSVVGGYAWIESVVEQGEALLLLSREGGGVQRWRCATKHARAVVACAGARVMGQVAVRRAAGRGCGGARAGRCGAGARAVARGAADRPASPEGDGVRKGARASARAGRTRRAVAGDDAHGAHALDRSSRGRRGSVGHGGARSNDQGVVARGRALPVDAAGRAGGGRLSGEVGRAGVRGRRAARRGAVAG